MVSEHKQHFPISIHFCLVIPEVYLMNIAVLQLRKQNWSLKNIYLLHQYLCWLCSGKFKKQTWEEETFKNRKHLLNVQMKWYKNCFLVFTEFSVMKTVSFRISKVNLALRGNSKKYRWALTNVKMILQHNKYYLINSNCTGRSSSLHVPLGPFAGGAEVSLDVEVEATMSGLASAIVAR